MAHRYEPDGTARPDHRGVRPCLHCPLPKGNRVHDEKAVAEREAAQAEHLRRIGDDR